MSNLTPADLRHLSAITKTERKVYAETQQAFALWSAAVVELVLSDTAVVAAVDPDRAGRAQRVWDEAMVPVLATLGALWKKRYALKGRNDAREKTSLAKFLARQRVLLAGVTTRIYADVSREVAGWVRSGLSDEQIRANLSEYLQPEGFDSHSRLIARTSTVSSYNNGAEEGWREFASTTGRSAVKTWNTILDGKARRSHAIANGQTVGLDEYFEVGGYFCQAPGAESLPVWEAANCRCVAEFKLEGAVVAAMDTLPNGWRGPIAGLGFPTGDNRQLDLPVDGLKTRDFPFILTRKHVSGDEDIPIGTVENAWVGDDGLLWGEGAFDLNGAEGAEAARKVGEYMLNFVSIDPDMVTGEQRLYAADGTPATPDVVERAIASGEVPEGYSVRMVFTDWRLSSLALVSIPAYQEARIEPVFDYVRPNRPTPGDGYVEVSSGLFEALCAGTEVQFVQIESDGPSRYDLAVVPVQYPDPEPDETDVIVAAMGGQIFKKASFERVATGPTPLTVDEDGSVYGHVRLYGTCYQYGGGQGNGGYCVEPPLSDCGYEKFHVHGAKLDDGSVISVGAITYGEGHESRGGLQASQDHYNNVGTMAAKVVASEDQWGVWVCGEVLDSQKDRAYDLLLSPMSGHWEPDADNGNHLEMLAAHIVVTPGYAVRGRRIVAGFDGDGNTTYIVAPSPMRTEADRPVENLHTKGIGMKDFRRAEALAKRAGVDRESRAARLRARLDGTL